METIENKDTPNNPESSRDRWKRERRERRARCADNNFHSQNPAGRILGGFVIVAVGALLLVKQLALVELPYWLFTWQMALVALGVFIGAKSNFRGGFWLIPVLIGGCLLLEQVYPMFQLRQYIWPAIIIFIGLFMIFGARRKRRWREHVQQWRQDSMNYAAAAENREDYLETVSVFGGVKKNVVSKNFKGGEVVTIFGGTEINLSQADIQGRVVLEVTQVFGGTSLIVPANWQIDPEMAAVLGGIEDKRSIPAGVVDPTKVLVLRGNSIFGGLEIKTY